MIDDGEPASGADRVDVSLQRRLQGRFSLARTYDRVEPDRRQVHGRALEVPRYLLAPHENESRVDDGLQRCGLGDRVVIGDHQEVKARSEERRVGKEWRTVGTGKHEETENMT